MKTKNYSSEFRKNYESLTKRGRTFVGSVDIIEDPELSCQAKILFYIISSLSFVKGYCYAANELLSKKLHLSLSPTKKYLKELEDAGIIRSEKHVSRLGIRRRIYIQFEHLIKRYEEANIEKPNEPNGKKKSVYRNRISGKLGHESWEGLEVD